MSLTTHSNEAIGRAVVSVKWNEKILYSYRRACRGRARAARRNHRPVRLAARPGPNAQQILAVRILGQL
jgi:hypothetical protein